MARELAAFLVEEGAKVASDLIRVCMRPGLSQAKRRAETIPEPAAPTAVTPTTQETVRELKRRLAKEIYRAEADLLEGLRIAGKPCRCLDEKHNLGIEAMTEELQGMDINPVYGRIVSWFRQHQQEFVPEEIAKRPPEYYKTLAPEVRAFRKELLGTPSWAPITQAANPGVPKAPKFIRIISGRQMGSIISYESWLKERDGMLQRGETPPKIEPVTETANPSNPAKEPWQMTRGEFIALYQQRHKASMSKEAYSRLTESELSAISAEAIDYQKHTIEQALKAGKPVPPDVLKDYPELIRTSGNPVLVAEAPPPPLRRVRIAEAEEEPELPVTDRVVPLIELTPEKREQLLSRLLLEDHWPEESSDNPSPTAVLVTGRAARKAVIEEDEAKRIHELYGTLIAEGYASTAAMKVIADRMGRGLTTIWHVLHREIRPPVFRPVTPERLEEVVGLRRLGLTLEAIGRKLGYTKQHVLWLLHQAGERLDIGVEAEKLNNRLYAVSQGLRPPLTIAKLTSAALTTETIADEAPVLLSIVPKTLPAEEELALRFQLHSIISRALLAEEMLLTGVWCLQEAEMPAPPRILPADRLRVCGQEAGKHARGTIEGWPGYRGEARDLALEIPALLPETAGSPVPVPAGGELSPSTIDFLAMAEGNPLRKFCCRQCGECAPKELLAEGRFSDRICWLREHYKEKHPSIWGRLPVKAPVAV